jgi:hypothetical protein
MSGSTERPGDWLLTFRSEGEGPPTVLRVRRLLKAALRAYGLRCVRVDEVPDDGKVNDDGRSDPRSA